MLTYSYLFADTVWTGQTATTYSGYNEFNENTTINYDFAPLTKSLSGVYYAFNSLDLNLFYNQVWIHPNYIDCKMVTRDLTYSVIFWNTYFFRTITVKNITNVNLNNVNIEDITNKSYKPLYYENFLVEVKKEGSATIDGYFDIETDDIGDYSHLKLTIRGLRIVLLPLYEYISGELSIRYEIPVVISSNMFNEEQRKVLVDREKKNFTGRFFVDILGKTSLMNLFELTGGMIVGVPYCIEPLTPVEDDLQYLSEFHVNEDFTNYREIFRCKYIFIYDKEQQNFTAEEVTSVDATNKKITLSEPISFSFKKKSTLVFPMILCKIVSINPKFIKGKYGEVNLELQEIYANL